MSLRLRLIVAFFLLSVVPLGAVTFYTYLSNASAMRVAAGREAELLAGELTERMRLVTGQLSQQFERLMELPAPDTLEATAVSRAAGQAASSDAGAAVSSSGTSTPTVARSAAATAAASAADEANRVASQLGEVAMLLNNIEVRGFRRGGRGGRPPGDGRGGLPGEPPGAPGARGGQASVSVPPAAAGGSDSVDGRDARGQGRRGTGDPAARGVPGEGPPPPSGPGAPGGPGRFGGNGGRGGDPPPSDPSRIQIDLRPIQLEILQQLVPDQQKFEQLTPEERERIFAAVRERMRGIEQGIQMLQQKAVEQAADAKAAATNAAAGAGTAGSAGDRATASASVKAAPAATPPVPPVAPAAPTRVRDRSSAPAAPAAPAAPVAPARTATAGAMQRTTELSGSRIDVRVEQDGEVVGQVNAEINLPNLLATVFTTTRRDRGEVPFAIDKAGRLYTPTDDDRARITALNTAAARPETAPGTTVLPNWVIVTTADPTGSELTFGIARPIGDALDDLRRSSARDAGLGLGLIGLALVGIVPLSSRLTRNLSRLSEGVEQIAQGDYRARVDVHSKDEIGTLAQAFNRMASEVERHQQSAVEQERLRRELELGRQIQFDMLPHAALRIGLTEIKGVSVPATEVGGDFFNYFQTSTGQIALLVGDVSGKGVGAALLMANIQASLRTRLAMGQGLAALAGELDADIAGTTPGAVYATLFVGLLDPVSRELAYVNAGHNPQYVLKKSGGLLPMESTGLPIGLLAGHGYLEQRLQLSAGDILFFYTDGCVEAENQTGEMFGNPRLERLLQSRPAEGDDVLAHVERDILAFRSGREPFDDATMMVVNVG